MLLQKHKQKKNKYLTHADAYCTEIKEVKLGYIVKLDLDWS